MNPIVLLILMALMAADALDVGEPVLSGWRMPATVVGSFALLIAVNGLLVSRLARRMDVDPDRATFAADRARLVSAAARWITLPLFAKALFALGWLGWLREAMGNIAIVPEVLAVLPPLVAIAVTWTWYHAIDVRLRQATLIRDLDSAGASAAEWTRSRYTLWHVRHQMAMFVALVGVIGAWSQIVDRWLIDDASPDWLVHGLPLLGGVAALVLAPLFVRAVWDTETLASGLLRDRLTAMCDAHGVRVRDLLVWRTHGGMINAAVIGLVGRLRYIIVTDGMIERLDDNHVEAIMAHELGHIRRRHLPWILVCAIALLAALTAIAEYALAGVADLTGADLDAWSDAAYAGLEVGVFVVIVAVWAGLFGIVSRQMERQADTFAAQHIASHRPEEGYGPGVIGPNAAAVVAETLRRVAALNHIPARRRAWRHGSIASRAAYLESLAGTPIDACEIDRRVRRTCIACALVLITTLALMTYAESVTTI